MGSGNQLGYSGRAVFSTYVFNSYMSMGRWTWTIYELEHVRHSVTHKGRKMHGPGITGSEAFVVFTVVLASEEI